MSNPIVVGPDVRVVAAYDYTEHKQRTAAQKAQDDILDKAETAALEAIAKTSEAIEWLGIVNPVRSRSAVTYVQQLHAEIVELRRIRQ